MSNEIIEISGNEIQAFQPQSLIAMAIEKDLALEKIEKLMELQERWESREAKKAYTKAMNAFKANPPQLRKTKQAGFNNVKYNYPDLAECMEAINPALAFHGLSANWKTDQNNGQISVTCTVTHTLGHSESTTLTAGVDNSGSKNAIQGIGSTVFYLQRYTILALTGLTARNSDDDGHGHRPPPPQVITHEQGQAIFDLIQNNGLDLIRFQKWIWEKFGHESIQAIHPANYQTIFSTLQNRVERKKAEFQTVGDNPTKLKQIHAWINELGLDKDGVKLAMRRNPKFNFDSTKQILVADLPEFRQFLLWLKPANDLLEALTAISESEGYGEIVTYILGRSGVEPGMHIYCLNSEKITEIKENLEALVDAYDSEKKGENDE